MRTDKRIHRPNKFAIRLTCIFILLLSAQILIKADEGYSNQLWFNFTLDYQKSEKLLFEFDLHPKVQVNGDVPWKNLNVTGLVEYYPNSWIDLTGELTLGASDLLPDLNAFQVTPRIGLRIHLFSTVEGMEQAERTPLKRIGLSNLARLEVRNFSYSGDQSANHELRFRNRLEVRIPINNEWMNIDRTFYLMSDLEAFLSISGQILQRFDTKLRFRFGFGYRLSYNWRAELLYIGEKARDTLADDLVITAESFYFRVKFKF